MSEARRRSRHRRNDRAEPRLEPGSESRCGRRASETGGAPGYPLTVVGIAEFPFEPTDETTIGGTLDALEAACGGNVGTEADMILVASTGDADGTAAAIRALRPELQRRDQHGSRRPAPADWLHLLPADLERADDGHRVVCRAADHRLLTVSVNQRLGEIAALRALGFSRWRVVTDVLCESALIVGGGGLLSLPLGLLLASGLDRILKRMPGIPVGAAFLRLRERRRSPSICCCSWPRRSSRRSTRCASSHAADRRDAARRGDRVNRSRSTVLGPAVQRRV